MTGFRVLWLFWLRYRVLEDVLLYWSDMLSGPVIMFALGFYVIASWVGSSVNYGTGYIPVFCWGKEQYLLAGV